MADIVSPEKRSQNMSAIRSKNTQPEVYLRKLLFAQGYRYRIADKSVPGHPDIFLRKYNTAIFVNGCFWHRHPGCKFAYTPKSRVEFWQKKFDDNLVCDSFTPYEEDDAEKGTIRLTPVNTEEEFDKPLAHVLGDDGGGADD